MLHRFGSYSTNTIPAARQPEGEMTLLRVDELDAMLWRPVSREVNRSKDSAVFRVQRIPRLALPIWVNFCYSLGRVR